MDDVIKLLDLTYAFDAYGNQIETRTERQVFCRVRSISRNEFYQAAQTDLHPEYVFTLSNYKDYLGEPELIYTDWSGVDHLYEVVRTYRNTSSDEIEIIAQEKIGNGYRKHSSPDGKDSQ